MDYPIHRKCYFVIDDDEILEKAKIIFANSIYGKRGITIHKSGLNKIHLEIPNESAFWLQDWAIVYIEGIIAALTHKH